MARPLPLPLLVAGPLKKRTRLYPHPYPPQKKCTQMFAVSSAQVLRIARICAPAHQSDIADMRTFFLGGGSIVVVKYYYDFYSSQRGFFSVSKIGQDDP